MVAGTIGRVHARPAVLAGSSSSTASITNGWIRANRPPRTMSRGLKMLTRTARPTPSHRPTWSRAATPRWTPRPHRRGPPPLRHARRHAACRPGIRSASSPTSVSQHPKEPHRQGVPTGSTGMCPTSPPIAGGARQRPAVDDQATADADLAGEEHHVGDADGRPRRALRERPEVRLVGDCDRDGHAERARQPVAERDVRQPRFGAM